MDFKNDQQISQLLTEAKRVPGTDPPVFMVDGILIGYDKLKQIRVIATANDPDLAPPVQARRIKLLTFVKNIFAKLRTKLSVRTYHHPDLASQHPKPSGLHHPPHV